RFRQLLAGCRPTPARGDRRRLRVSSPASIDRIFLNDVKWLALVQIALRVKGFLVLPFITRELGAVDFGIWTQATVVSAMVMPFLMWGTVPGFIREKSGTSLDARRRTFHAWIYCLGAL